MNLSVPPPTHSGDARSPEDELDGLLRDFWRAEMPHPWPPFRASAARQNVLPARSRPGLSLRRSRLALAASVALLIVGALLLSSSLRDGNAGLRLSGMSVPEATHTKPIRLEESIEVNRDGPASIRVNAAYEQPLPRE